MWQFITIIIITAFVLQQCTPVNIIPSALHRTKLSTYRYLKEGVESDSYRIDRLPGAYPPSITFCSELNFFIAEGKNYIQKTRNKSL